VQGGEKRKGRKGKISPQVISKSQHLCPTPNQKLSRVVTVFPVPADALIFTKLLEVYR